MDFKKFVFLIGFFRSNNKRSAKKGVLQNSLNYSLNYFLNPACPTAVLGAEMWCGRQPGRPASVWCCSGAHCVARTALSGGGGFFVSFWGGDGGGRVGGVRGRGRFAVVVWVRNLRERRQREEGKSHGRGKLRNSWVMSANPGVCGCPNNFKRNQRRTKTKRAHKFNISAHWPAPRPALACSNNSVLIVSVYISFPGNNTGMRRNC